MTETIRKREKLKEKRRDIQMKKGDTPRDTKINLSKRVRTSERNIKRKRHKPRVRESPERECTWGKLSKRREIGKRQRGTATRTEPGTETETVTEIGNRQRGTVTETQTTVNKRHTEKKFRDRKERLSNISETYV